MSDIQTFRISTDPAAGEHGLRPDMGRRLCLRMAAALPTGLLLLQTDGFAKNRRRIVCVGGALTEIIYALGADKDLVGVDLTSHYPEAVRKLANVGYMRTLSSEGILALAPDWLLVTEDAGPAPVLQQIAAAGVRVEVLNARHRFEGLLERVQKIGHLLQMEAQAGQLQVGLRTNWQQALSRLQARNGKSLRVLFVMSHSPSQIMVAGAGSAAQAMLEYAGLVNAVHGVNGYKPLTTEAVIAARPEVILFTNQGLQAIGGVDAALRLPGVAQTPAGQKKKVVAMDALLLLGFGPRLPQALNELNDLVWQAGRV